MLFRYIIFMLSLTLCFSACRKDEVIVDDPEIIIAESEELEVTELVGIITNRAEEGVVDANVQLILDDSIIQETTTDENGEFILTDIFTGEEYLIYIQSDLFYAAINSVDLSEDSISEPLDITLVSEEELPFIGFGNEFSPFDEDVITVSGKVENSSGEGVETLIFIWGEDETWSNYALTDAEGNFATLVKKDEAFLLFPESVCAFSATNTFGPFGEDENLGSFQIEDEISTITISGNVTDCEGNPVEEGMVIIFSNQITVETSINNGFYETSISTCENDFIHIFATSDDVQSIFPEEVIIQGNPTLELDFELCNPADGFFTITLDSLIDIELGNHIAWEDEYGWGVIEVQPSGYGFEENSVHFTLFREGFNAYTIHDFCLTLDEQLYFGEESSLDVTISSLPDDAYLEGEIEGMLFDFANDKEVYFSADFKLPKFN